MLIALNYGMSKSALKTTLKLVEGLAYLYLLYGGAAFGATGPAQCEVALSAPKAVEVPGEFKFAGQIATGKATFKDKAAWDHEIYAKLNEHWREHFSEPVGDSYGHRKNGLEMIHRLVATLKLKDATELEKEFLTGRFAEIKLYTEEEIDPRTLKGTGVPNYRLINTALRTYDSLEALQLKEPRTAEKIKKIDAVLEALPPVQGVVYRGTQLTMSQIQEIIQTGFMTEKALTSTTLDIVDGFDFLQRALNVGEKRRVFMTIYTRTGRYIPYGQFAKEDEVLIPRGARFKLNYHFEYKDTDVPENDAIYLFLSEQ